MCPCKVLVVVDGHLDTWMKGVPDFVVVVDEVMVGWLVITVF